MKHQGKARAAAFRLILLALFVLAVLVSGGVVARLLGGFLMAISGVLLVAWVLFGAFALYFFRDPNPDIPNGTGLVVSPAYATVDAIDEIVEKDFMHDKCQRVSMFLSVFDVHVQYTPVSGRVALVKHTPGQYLNAMKADSAQFNENVLVGFESDDPRGERVGVRLIAGLIARRIVPFLETNERPARGERMSLIQFGSRVDVYLPRRATVKVKLGDKVAGGETILAAFEQG